MKTPLLAALLALPGMAFAHDDGDRPVGLLERICAENEHVDDELDEVGFCSLSLEAQRRQLNKMMVTTRRLNNANRYYFDPAETGSRAHIQLKRPGMTRFRYRFTRFEYTGHSLTANEGCCSLWIARSAVSSAAFGTPRGLW